MTYVDKLLVTGIIGSRVQFCDLCGAMYSVTFCDIHLRPSVINRCVGYRSAHGHSSKHFNCPSLQSGGDITNIKTNQPKRDITSPNLLVTQLISAVNRHVGVACSAATIRILLSASLASLWCIQLIHWCLLRLFCPGYYQNPPGVKVTNETTAPNFVLLFGLCTLWLCFWYMSTIVGPNSQQNTSGWFIDIAFLLWWLGRLYFCLRYCGCLALYCT